jgi:hypothetical protein
MLNKTNLGTLIESRSNCRTKSPHGTYQPDRLLLCDVLDSLAPDFWSNVAKARLNAVEKTREGLQRIRRFG